MGGFFTRIQHWNVLHGSRGCAVAFQAKRFVPKMGTNLFASPRSDAARNIVYMYVYTQYMYWGNNVYISEGEIKIKPDLRSCRAGRRPVGRADTKAGYGDGALLIRDDRPDVA